jgi:hypothetical protein
MTDAALMKWLEDVEAVAAREGARWRGLRLPGDLSLNGWTEDRVLLHAVGDKLVFIGNLAQTTRKYLLATRPKGKQP